MSDAFQNGVQKTHRGTHKKHKRLLACAFRVVCGLRLTTAAATHIADLECERRGFLQTLTV